MLRLHARRRNLQNGFTTPHVPAGSWFTYFSSVSFDLAFIQTHAGVDAACREVRTPRRRRSERRHGGAMWTFAAAAGGETAAILMKD